MKISKEQVMYVARLARLDLNDADIAKFAGQISEILNYVETLKRVDTADVAPTSHTLPLVNAFREDLEEPSLKREVALENAPEKEDGGFVVPKIIP